MERPDFWDCEFGEYDETCVEETDDEYRHYECAHPDGEIETLPHSGTKLYPPCALMTEGQCAYPDYWERLSEKKGRDNG